LAISIVILLLNSHLENPSLPGIVGALVITRWAYGLLKDTGSILLDRSIEREQIDSIHQSRVKSGQQRA
jgi:Co/Zn/Cd efflux system component